MVTNFGKIIDNIRKEKNMTVNQVIYGVCSKKQYYRYLQGDDIKIGKLLLLLENVEMDLKYFLKSSSHIIDPVRVDLNNAIKSLNSWDNNTLKYTLEKHESTCNNNAINKALYSFLHYSLMYRQSEISQEKYLSLLTKIIEFPECLKKDYLNIVEINVLFYMFKDTDNFEKYGKHFTEKLIHLIENEQFDLIENLNIVVNTVQLLGRNNLFTQCKNILEAVRCSLSLDSRLTYFTNLSYFYSLTLMNLNEQEHLINFYRTLTRCLVEIESDQTRKNTIDNAIRNDIAEFHKTSIKTL